MFSCGSRFTTFERIQLRELIVVKRNGKKYFDREKIVKSMEIALRKRKVDNDVVERAQNGIVRQLESSEVEIQSDLIGGIMNALGQIDRGILDMHLFIETLGKRVILKICKNQIEDN